MKVLHVLGNEEHPVAIPEKPVIRERLSGEGIDRGVTDDDAQVVFALLEIRSDVETVGWVPDHTCQFSVHEDLGRLPDRAFEIGAHGVFAIRGG